MTGKQIARALRRAARVVDWKPLGLCEALKDEEAREWLDYAMSDVRRPATSWWGNPRFYHLYDQPHLHRNARILGALFAAHYAEDEL